MIMGVDARMYVKLSKPISKGELKHKSYLFGQAFHHLLMIGFGDEIYYRPLETKKEDYESGEDWDIKIPLTGRYYGPGYERGPIFDYISIANFLESILPGCTIMYGGDSGEELIIFNKQYRDAMINHFITHNGRVNYVDHFDRDKNGPDCPVCEVRMTQNGSGNKYALYTCIGCGWMERHKDGLITKGFSFKDQ